MTAGNRRTLDRNRSLSADGLDSRHPGTAFAADCGTTEGFGLSVFLRDGDRVSRTYFTAGAAHRT